MWTTLQGRGDVDTPMDLIDANLAALDRQNAMRDQIAWAAKVHLQKISRITNLQKDLVAKGYIPE